MNKIFNNRTVLISGLLSTPSKDEFTFEQYKAARGLFILDPWERVKSIFSKDALGNRHPELLHAIQMAELGGIVGFFLGGLAEAAQKTQSYIHRTDTNIFLNKNEAYRALANHSTLAFINGGVRTAPSFILFFGGFFLLSSCCEAYRNKPAIADSIVAGTVVGGLSRLMYGIKGMISGGILGTVLGTIYGSTVWCITKISNTDQMELKYAQFALSRYKKEFHDSPKANDDILFKLYKKFHSRGEENTSEDTEKEDKSSKDTEEN